MSTSRGPLVVAGSLALAVVVQTTVFGRFRVGGVAPDVVLLALILASLRLRSEVALLTAFTAGLAFDALSSTAMGLRAAVYPLIVYVALRTRDRADFSAVAVAGWVALLTVGGVVLFLLLGTIFSQVALDGGEALRRVLLVPLLNLVIAVMLVPLIARLLHASWRAL